MKQSYEPIECIQKKTTQQLEAQLYEECTDKKALLCEVKGLQEVIAEFKNVVADVRVKFNSLQSSNEELQNRNQKLEEQLDEVHQKLHKNNDVYKASENKLQQSLQEFREEIKMLYEQKMQSLQAATKSNSSAIEELLETRTRVDSLNNRLSELESTKATLKACILDLEQLLENEGTSHVSDVANLEAELQRLHNAMVQKMREDQLLTDMEISLDLEIGAYNKLLSGKDYFSKLEWFVTMNETAGTDTGSSDEERVVEEFVNIKDTVNQDTPEEENELMEQLRMENGTCVQPLIETHSQEKCSEWTHPNNMSPGSSDELIYKLFVHDLVMVVLLGNFV
ncbi:lamin-B1-like isoform X4 [Musca autumnalis]|uniref:lamin-B1-like isoform X4 n=1 Tax=Musca autumnalis TaxID=221902 RepID=UPI003CF72375